MSEQAETLRCRLQTCTSHGDIQLNRDAQNGLLTGTTVGKLNTQRSYSRFGELSEETASYQDKTLFHSSYVRDKAGRITQKIETNQGFTRTTDYRYDTIGRLIEVKQDGVLTESYQYDANGNRLNNNALYDEQDRLLRYGLNSYAYTKNGELLTKNDTSYHYDVFGNLRQVQLPGKSIEYVIDASNRRVGKKVNGQLVQGFIYQGKLKPVAELDANGLLVARFVYGTKANIPDYILKNGNTYRVISDHLGSPRLVVEVQTGAVVQSMVFDAFGQVIQDSNLGFQPFGFAGGLYDSDTKLVRFGARDYDSEIGRWTSKDPINFRGGSANLYGYVTNDPINWVDITGFSRFDNFYNLPKQFWNWLHRHPDDISKMKDANGQLPEDIAKSYYDEWIGLGKPKPDSKGRNRNQDGYVDPELLIDLTMPWWLTPTKMGADPCELPGGPSCSSPVKPQKPEHCE